MRRGTVIGIGRRLARPSSLPISKQTVIPFSTSSGGGGDGRGRGHGRGVRFLLAPARVEFTTQLPTSGQPECGNPKPDPPGLGHGCGKPLPLPQPSPSFSPFFSSVKPNSVAGRGQTGSLTRDSVGPTKPNAPIFFRREDESDLELTSGGWGKPVNPPSPEVQIEVVNQHVQARPNLGADQTEIQTETRTEPRAPKLTREEAVRKALGILASGGEEGDGGGRGRGGRGRGMRGRGKGRGRGDFRASDRGDRRKGKEAEDEYGSGLYLGDNADGEKLAKKLGPEIMSKLEEGFQEMSTEVFPSPMADAHIDALHTNFMIECEPEYLMGVFDKNPDIDEKPPISLEEALEKMKPFLMTYEGIQSQEDWEEIVKETMEVRVPLLKKIVDHYSGPDRVTAKRQQEELERVAKTLPENVPDSVKQFTDRAVLSLQSNPGWGFHRKCQFMDKLVDKVSQHY